MKKLTIAAVLALSIALTGCTAEKPIESFYIGMGARQCYAAVGDSLMTATTTSVRVFDAKGEAVLDKSCEFKYPTMSENADNAVVYDIGGTNVVYLDGSALDAKNNIISADLSQSGHLALCTEEAGYKGSVTVYSADKTEVYKWLSADNWVVKAAVSPEGTRLAVLVSGENGSIVKLFKLDSTDEQGSFAADQAVFNDICWLGERVCCIASDRLYFCSDTGKAEDEYSFDGNFLDMFAVCGDNIVLELRAHSHGGAGTLVSIDSSSNLVGTAKPGAEIETFDFSNGKLLCLTQNKLLCYDDSLSLGFEAEQAGAQTALLRSSDAVFISGTEVRTTDIN
ncbi:MAG: DUF5711 family protein [Firmicutes bacterium]|nr:DUF5711 family protein [Bacillota bacterium]